MKIFFDTEFYENGSTIELISIGIIREDGKRYYAETNNSHVLCLRDNWLIENVKPHLFLPNVDLKSKEEIAIDIIEFVGKSPEFWGYFADYDWVVLCQLYGRMIDLPTGWPMFCMDLKQLAITKGFVNSNGLPSQNDGPEHNALADAIWNKEIYEFLENK